MERDPGLRDDYQWKSMTAWDLLPLRLREIPDTSSLKVGLDLYFLHLFLRGLSFQLCLGGGKVVLP